ncbi:unnamed protein product [Brassica napus]|uniref:(rape) hypothetical protein n=1 Tax=Brassica napus TaxID=3708 RepID=A0A816JQJ1_BRANA|nr:unnamed protein product [Brassica napus]
MATIRMDNFQNCSDTSVTMSLFDAQAVKIHNQLEQIGVDPRVVVATSQCSSSNGDTDVLHRPWLNEIYRVPESSHNNNQASSIPSVCNPHGSNGENTFIPVIGSSATMMPASVNVNRLATHQTNLEAGTVYSLTGFEVTRCNQDYRLSDSSLLIRFTDSTTFEKITDPAVPIPLESFRFRNYSEMLRLANSNNQLPDLIGKITAVKSTITEPPLDKNRVSATIKMDNDTSVTLTLFDAQAVKIHNQLAQMAVDPRICVATSVNPRMVGGRLFFNGTAGTHIHFDVETVAGESLFSSGLLEQDTGLAPVGRLVRSFAKVETLSIAELNDFVLNASSQNIDFICTGKVTGIKLDKGWCYVSCAKCFRKLHRSVSSLTCLSCNNTDAVGILRYVLTLIKLNMYVKLDVLFDTFILRARYRVEISIADETGEGLFVAFDGVMAKLHNMRAHEAVNLLPGNDVNPEESDAPQFVLDMEGNTYTFQVKVGPYNFTANNHSFTISRILGEGDPEPQPAFVDDGAADDNGDDNNDV